RCRQQGCAVGDAPGRNERRDARRDAAGRHRLGQLRAARSVRSGISRGRVRSPEWKTARPLGPMPAGRLGQTRLRRVGVRRNAAVVSRMSVPRGARRLRRLFDRIPPRLITVAELLVSLAITVLVAAWLDRAYTKYVSGPRVSAPSTDNCWGPDPRMHHTLRPNCSGLIHWGKESYAVHTNNLGLRDAQVSDVPMAEERTRVLLLGDSMVEGVQAWPDIIAGIIQAQLPQYRFLDGGRTSYSPSNYLLLTRSLLERGVKFDEVMVFIDISDIQDEAAYYRDNEQTGGLEGPSVYADQSTWYARQRVAISARYYLTDVWFTDLEYLAIRSGFYFKPFLQMGNVFDLPRGAWTYRSVSDALPYSSGYGPLGLGAGLEKAKAKM